MPPPLPCLALLVHALQSHKRTHTRAHAHTRTHTHTHTHTRTHARTHAGCEAILYFNRTQSEVLRERNRIQVIVGFNKWELPAEQVCALMRYRVRTRARVCVCVCACACACVRACVRVRPSMCVGRAVRTAHRLPPITPTTNLARPACSLTAPHEHTHAHAHTHTHTSTHARTHTHPPSSHTHTHTRARALQHQGQGKVDLYPSPIPHVDNSDFWCGKFRVPENAYELNFVFTDGAWRACEHGREQGARSVRVLHCCTTHTTHTHAHARTHTLLSCASGVCVVTHTSPRHANTHVTHSNQTVTHNVTHNVTHDVTPPNETGEELFDNNSGQDYTMPVTAGITWEEWAAQSAERADKAEKERMAAEEVRLY
jgi:hypothetical protein